MEDEDLKTDPDLMSFCPVDGYVCYGAVVKFVDCVTGLALPPMVSFSKNFLLYFFIII